MVVEGLKASDMQPSSWYFVQLIIKVFEEKNDKCSRFKSNLPCWFLFLLCPVQVSEDVSHFSLLRSSHHTQLSVPVTNIKYTSIFKNHTFADSWPIECDTIKDTIFGNGHHFLQGNAANYGKATKKY